MKVVVPRERAEGETRVAATPRTVKRMVRGGLAVHVESSAGTASGISDAEFVEAAKARVGDGSPFAEPGTAGQESWQPGPT